MLAVEYSKNAIYFSNQREVVNFVQRRRNQSIAHHALSAGDYFNLNSGLNLVHKFPQLVVIQPLILQLGRFGQRGEAAIKLGSAYFAAIPIRPQQLHIEQKMPLLAHDAQKG